MADDGQVRIGIYVDNEGVKSSMDQATQTVKEGTKEMSDAAKEAGKDIGDSVSEGFNIAKLRQNFKEVESQVRTFAKTIAATATSFGIWVKQSAQSIDRIDKMSQKLGLSRKAFQELDYAASQTGLSVTQFSGAMRTLVNSTKTGGDAIKRLGVSLKTATGEMKSQEDLFFEVINKLADMPAGIERTQLGFELLGRNFQTLAPLINKGSAGIEELRRKFHELGLEVSDQTVDDFVEFNDTLADFSKALKSSFNNALKGLIPQLKTMVSSFTQMLEPGGKLNNLISKLADVLYKFVTKVLPPFIDGLNWVLDNATAVAAGITAIAVAVKALTGNWVGAVASGLIGLFSTVAISSNTAADKVKDVDKSIQDLDKTLKTEHQTVVRVSGTIEQMKEMVRLTGEELELLKKKLTLLRLDTSIADTKEFAKQEENLKNKIKDAEAVIRVYTQAIEEYNQAQAELEAMESQIDYFEGWTTAVAKAEQQLKKFIATKAKDTGVFKLELLSEEDQKEFKRLTDVVDSSKDKLKTLEDAFEHANKEIAKTDAFQKWSDALAEAEEDLKDFVALKAGLSGNFDITLLSEEDKAQFDDLKARVDNARKALDTLKDTLRTTTAEEQENVAAVALEEDAFKKWTDAVNNAEKKLKAFIASKAEETGGVFDLGQLNEADLAVYQQLKGEVDTAKKALESMNAALRETKDEVVDVAEEVGKTDAFERWTKAVEDAEEALKEFVAAKAGDTGTFDINKLTESERQHFESLKQTVQDAKDQLKSLQDATETTVEDTSNSLVDVADTIATAWGRIGTALGNGIETTAQILLQGEGRFRDLAWSMADALTDTLSAVGDALIQTGIAKQVIENLGNVSGAYAITMGLAIKAAAGSLKGIFDKLKAKDSAGEFAQGGIVGGSSYSGDRLIARVNSGEMILNRQQQRQLFALANGGGGNGRSSANIQIINNAGADVSAEQSPDGRSIKVLVERITENMLKGVKGSKIMGSTYGIRQLGRR